MEIKQHMNVVGSDGTRVGTVDRIEGDRIKLARSDSGEGGHHYLGKHLVDRVDAEQVHLSLPAAEARAWAEN